MRKLKICEHISLDGVIQVSGDGDFPYGDWTGSYRTPAGRDESSRLMARASICCLAGAPTICGRASGRRRRAVLCLTALLAAIARVTHDIGIAEELAQDALVTALEVWTREGIPENPGAWLMQAATG